MEIDEAVRIIRESSFSRLADWLIPQLRPSGRIVVDSASPLPHDNLVSHLGGLPYLPDGMPWPEWDKSQYLQSQIDRLEKKFRKTPRAIGLRDIAARMRDDL